MGKVKDAWKWLIGMISGKSDKPALNSGENGNGTLKTNTDWNKKPAEENHKEGKLNLGSMMNNGDKKVIRGDIIVDKEEQQALDEVMGKPVEKEEPIEIPETRVPSERDLMTGAEKMTEKGFRITGPEKIEDESQELKEGSQEVQKESQDVEDGLEK